VVAFFDGGLFGLRNILYLMKTILPMKMTVACLLKKRKIRDPQIVITKGALKGKRVQTCGKCRGIGHTRRTCPKNANAKYSRKKSLDDLDCNEGLVQAFNIHQVTRHVILATITQN